MKTMLLLPFGGLIAAASTQAAGQAAALMPVANQGAIAQMPSGDIVFRDYPARARAAGEQGRVGFFIKLNAKGNPARCEISRSSGYPQLDQETCRLLLTHAKFQRSMVGDERKVVHNGVVNWSLATHAATAAMITAQSRPRMVAAATPAPRSPPTPKWLGWNRTAKQDRNTAGEKLVCKRLPRTGTLSGFEHRCRSAASWAKPDEVDGFWSDLQGRKGSGIGTR